MNRLSKLPEPGGNCESQSFILADEGYTLGNALRHVISQYPEVTLCGCSITHPSESKMLLRIQTKGGNAIEILKRGLQDLDKICDYTLETFDIAYEEYKASQNVPTNTT